MGIKLNRLSNRAAAHVWIYHEYIGQPARLQYLSLHIVGEFVPRLETERLLVRRRICLHDERIRLCKYTCCDCVDCR